MTTETPAGAGTPEEIAGTLAVAAMLKCRQDLANEHGFEEEAAIYKAAADEITKLVTALRASREAALEEAAKVAEEMRGRASGFPSVVTESEMNSFAEFVAKHVAAKIRSLKEPQ